MKEWGRVKDADGKPSYGTRGPVVFPLLWVAVVAILMGVAFVQLGSILKWLGK